MKNVAKIVWLLLLPLSLAKGEMRTYHSKDGSKTFRGDLMEYDAKSKMVKMRMGRGKIMNFPLKVLSAEDQAFVEKQGPILLAKRSLSIETKHRSKRTEKNKPAPGQWHFEKFDHHYEVEVKNFRDKHLDEVEVEYVFYIERNRREYQEKIEKVSGSETLELLLANSSETVTTKSANLESWSDNPVMPAGGGGG